MAGERGWFGFGLKFSGEGFFLNPTVKSVTVGSLVPVSPAARSPIAVGDTIYRVEGVPMTGRKAKELSPWPSGRWGRPCTWT
ncbi:PDZ domain-containing protein [Lysobacter sp. CFH 32150]|uniref:PDZ domain-containing protein n=1 Tax=Lysobacter sp. CFH 32150 TaxID=2927128 RepID=UPI001FA81290|nr:PDZ domain-containing protein [Lysobacter sp. CFH 32150]